MKNFKNLSKRGLSLFLALVMCLGMLQTTAFADNEGPSEDTEVSQTEVVTQEPSTETPTEPKAEEPKAEEPKAEEPKAEEPKAEEPKAEEPKAEEPKAEEPKAEEPKAEEPKAEEPKAEEPKAEEPKAEEPKAEEPKAEEPKAEEPKAEEPKAEEPKAEEPKAEEPKAEEPTIKDKVGDTAGGAADGLAEKINEAVDSLKEEKPEVSYATVEEFDAACEQVGLEEATLREDLEAALDIYAKLSYEDQSARAEDYDALQSCLDNLDREPEEYPEISSRPRRMMRANWNPSDTITINVRVFDQSTGAVYKVGTDTVQKGNQYIQSVNYRIPQLNTFTNKTFGKVIKVVGNWYFPAHDSSVGASVEWSCNVSSVTMTYWVDSFNPSGSSTQPEASGSYYLQVVYVNKSKTAFSFGVRKAMNTNRRIAYYDARPAAPKGYELKGWQTAHYHGTANAERQTGGILTKEWWPIMGSSGNRLYVWSEKSDPINYYANLSGGDPTLYLIYQATGVGDGGESKTSVTLTYKDGTATYDTQTYFSGDTVIVTNNTNTKAGYTFLGWDTSSAAKTAVYKPENTFTITTNTTLYAVWAKNCTVTYVDGAANGNAFTQQDNQTYVGATTPAFNGNTSELTYTDSTGTYNFKGWDKTIAATVTGDTTYTAQWEKQSGGATEAEYKVKWQDTDGNTLAGTETRGPATVGTTVSATNDDKKTIAGYTYKENLSTTSAEVKADGTTELVLVYAKNLWVKWVDENGTQLDKKDFCKGDTEPAQTIPNPTKASDENYDYAFDDWNRTEDADGNVTYTATYTATRKTPVNPDKPALSIVKTVADIKGNPVTSIKKGGTLVYTITVTNNGGAEATGVKVTDTLPEELSYVSKSTNGANEPTAQGNDLTWNLNPIEAGKSVTFTFKAINKVYDSTVDGYVSKTGNIKNVAVVDCDETEEVESDPVPTAIYSFAVTKKNDGFVSEKGTGKATVHYTVTVTNDGTINLYGLNIKDVLTSEIKINNQAVTAAQAEMKLVPTSVKLNGTAVTVDDEGTLYDLGGTRKLSVVAADGAEVQSKAVNTTEWKLVLGRGTVFAPNDVVTLEYDIEITNLTKSSLYVKLDNTATCGTWTSPETIVKALVRGMFKAAPKAAGNDGYVEESASSNASAGTSGAGGTIDPVDPVKKVTVTWVDEDGTELHKMEDVKTTEIPDAGKYNELSKKENPTKASDEDYDYTFAGWDKSVDPTTGDVTYTAKYDKHQKPDSGAPVTIGKTVSNATPKAGDTITYTVTITNKTNQQQTVTFKDVLPAGLKLGPYIEQQIDLIGAVSGSGLNWTFTLKANGKATFTYTATVQAGATGVLTNKATATVDGKTYEAEKSVTVTKPTEYTITVKYQDEAGNAISGYSESTVATSNGGQYDVTDKQVTIPDYTFKKVKDGKKLADTVAADTEIVLVYTKNGGGSGETEKIKLTIEIVGDTNTVTYDGNKHEVNGYEVKTTLPANVSVALATGKAAHAEGTAVGTYNMGLTRDSFVLTGADADKYEVTFTVTDGCLKIEPVSGGDPVLDVTAGNVETTYDGTEHPIDPDRVKVTLGDEDVTPDSVTITYVDENGNSVDVPKDAGTYTATITVTKDGKMDSTTATVTINKKELTVTTDSASKTYDGTALTAGGRIEGLVEGEATFAVTGTQTEIGNSRNTYTLTWAEGFKVDNYALTETIGTLTVNRSTGGGGGGGNRPTPTPTPDPDPEPPVVDVPEVDPPLVDIPEVDPPLVDLPEVDPPLVEIPEVDPPLVDIPDEDVPLADVPKTDDRTALWQLSALMSAAGLLVLTALERKQRRGE